MKDTNLLNDKFTPPKLPDICASRHTLLNLFHKEMSKRVIYVSAPAGCGKTVSTRLWLEKSDRKVIWIGLDEYDNTLPIFYKLFCTGILSLQPENKVMESILKSPSFASSPVEHTIRLLSEFRPDGERYAVVLDDMHLVTNKEIRKSGLLVQKRLPSSFGTVILTRNEIAKEYTAITGEEKCAIITAQDLAFSVAEIQMYCNNHGRFLTTEETAAMHAVTDGWAIAINAMVMSGAIELGQNGRHILDNYIKTQIWDKWDDDLKNFMMKTSVGDEMTPELAEKLTGYKNAHKILDGLCAKNAFVSKTNDDTYRYHHLFLKFLRNILEQDSGIDNKALYKIASDYYLKKMNYFLARRDAIKSGDSEAIINASYALYNTGKSHSVDAHVNFYRYFLKDPIPTPLCEQHPYIYSQYAWYYFLIGDAPQVEYYMDKLYLYLPVIVRDYPQFIESLFFVTFIDHRASISDLMEKIKSVLPNVNLSCLPQASSISMQLPYAHRSIRDYCEFSDKTVLGSFVGTVDLLLKNQCDVVILELRSGFLYERSMLNESLKIALQTRTSVNDGTIDEVVFCSFIILASIYFALGKETLLADVIEQTEEFIEKSGSHCFRPNFEAFKTKTLLVHNNKTAAKAWLDNYYITETEQLELYKIFQHFTTVRAYIVLAQTDRAMRYILKLKKLGTDFRRPLDIAEASVLQAILEWAFGYKKEALDTLEEALTAIQEYGFTRVIADEGAAVLPILKKLSKRIEKIDYQGDLNPFYVHSVYLSAYEQSKRHKGITVNINTKPVKLSKQQKKILTFLSKGYKYTEIMEETGLTIHTVKSHASAAYAKLGVNNSRDAALKARELGIIE